jgi:hypothetical protein
MDLQVISISTIMTMMTTEMKKNYMSFIKEGNYFPIYLKVLREKEIWDADKTVGSCNINTAGVNINHVSMRLILRRADDIFGKPVKMKINPLLQSQLCFQNSKFLEKTYGWKQVAGFNIMSCRCGGVMGFEIHSVNEKDGELVDYTKDFDDERYKWFLPLKTENQAVHLKAYMGISEFQKRGKCTCPVDWRGGGGEQITDVECFQSRLRQAANIKILN